MNEIDKFFSDLPSEDKQVADVFDEKKQPEISEKKPDVVETEDEGDVRKNRRHRRLEEQLQRERESNIALNERVKALAEAREYAAKNVNSSDVDPRLVEVFGNTEVGKEVAKRLEDVLSERDKRTREETLQEIENRQIEAQREQQEYEAFIDSKLESLEDQYNIDLTSSSPRAKRARNEFLGMIEKLSPKDQDGTLLGYADFESTFEIYQGQQNTQDQERTTEVSNRQKEIASRSMQKSGQNSGGNTQQATPGFRGWMKDYNIQQ